MGEQAEEIYATFALSEENFEKFSAVVEKFDEYFIPRRNVTFERVIFNTRLQQDGKPAIKKLQILTFVNAIAGKGNRKEEFPAVFQGLGKLLKEHRIQLQPGAKPFAFSSPRHMPRLE
ncbi:hypothetical protein MRX96_058236 [Rhipicephalus microplus]